MFHLIFGFPWLVVVLRFILPLPWVWTAKVGLALVLLLASQYHMVAKLSSGSVFSPEFPRPFILMFNVAFGAILLLMVFQLLLDVISLALLAVRGHFPAVPATLRYAMGITALALAGFGVSQAVRVPPIKDIDIVIADLPPAFDGYKILQLTDLHISRLFPAAWTERVVTRANGLDVDLILMTGDLIDGRVEDRRPDVEPLLKLHARDGIYAVPGNHEYFFGYPQWMQEYERLKLRPLINSHTVLERGEDRLVIAGVTDVSAPATGFPGPNVAAAIRGAPERVPVILMDHQPREADKTAKLNIALQLSGHTHGGMIVGFDRILALFNNGFVSGLYQVGAMQLYVNNGTALWPGFALRLGKPAELTRITLRRAPTGNQ